MYKLTLTDAKLRTGKRIKVGVDCEKSMKKALDCSATYEEEEEEEEEEKQKEEEEEEEEEEVQEEKKKKKHVYTYQAS